MISGAQGLYLQVAESQLTLLFNAPVSSLSRGVLGAPAVPTQMPSLTLDLRSINGRTPLMIEWSEHEACLKVRYTESNAAPTAV